MDEFTYTSFGKKATRHSLNKNEFGDLLTLKDFFKEQWDEITSEDLSKAFCNDLRKLLEKEDIYEIIEGIFQIENNLNSLHYDKKLDLELPSFEEFYKNLSPTFLRSIWEAKHSDSPIESVIEGWKESLRISIEEELYVWQEKN